jgi:hypothetical protein
MGVGLELEDNMADIGMGVVHRDQEIRMAISCSRWMSDSVIFLFFFCFFVSLYFTSLELGQEIRGSGIVRLLGVATGAAAMCAERTETVDSMPTREVVERRF